MIEKIDFIIIGAQKAGTTSLAANLSEHPEVCFCTEKEPHFFSLTPDWNTKLKAYHSLYRPQAGQICGEASTSYSFLSEYAETPQRLYQYNPDLNIIYLLRDPIERIRSHYSHRLMRGRAEPDSEKEIFNNREYIERTKYGSVIQSYEKYFDSGQILILLFEEFIRKPQDVIESVYDFLNIRTIRGVRHQQENKSALHNSGGNITGIKHYIEFILTFAPLFMRRILSKHITIKLRNKPDFSTHIKSRIIEDLSQDLQKLERKFPAIKRHWISLKT
jgi:hypothetical protein